MDLSDYVREGGGDVCHLSAKSLLPLQTLLDLMRNPSRRLRYTTALRLVRASNGAITLDALRQRGELQGEEMFSGPLGAKIADVIAEGESLSVRLARVGIRYNYLVETLTRGAIPRKRTMEKLSCAFDGALSLADFEDHAAWRKGRASQGNQAGGSEV